jgi:hypothetical protein
MISRNVTLPEVGLIAGTRVALGIGVGFLLAGRLSPESRRAAGWSLLAVGALSTIPLAANLIWGGQTEQRAPRRMSHSPSGESEEMEMEWAERAPAAEL